ncbi:MAG: J domain-containing protein [Dehalococcoidia bacterium]|nr:J domain-containing protein [Dehalococcoidia bacterium]
MAQDYYETLGVARTGSDKEIRAAYRRLARRFHPDVNPGNADAERRFKEINAAHEVLSDAEKRKKYDRYGDQWEHADQLEEMRRRQQAAGGFGGPPGAGFPGQGFPGGPGATFSFGGDIGDILGGARGGGGMFDSLLRRAAGRQRGQDAEQLVRVSLVEAYAGAMRTIEIRAGEQRCIVCGGAGQLAGATCHACRGTGSGTPLQRVEVSIPPGVQDDQRIRVTGKGGPGSAGGAAGDLYLRVQVAPDERFERRGDDLHVDVDVPVVDAALGGEVQVPTLKARPLSLRVPAGTQGGKVFRAVGQGMPKAAGGFGDLLARVRLVLPDPLTDEERRLFEQLRASRVDAARADGVPGGAG